MLRLLPPCLIASTTLALAACGGGGGSNGSSSNALSNNNLGNNGPGLKTGPEIAQEVAVVSGLLAQTDALGSAGNLPLGSAGKPVLTAFNKARQKIDIQATLDCDESGQATVIHGSDEYQFSYFTPPSSTSVSYYEMDNQNCVFVYYDEPSLSDPNASSVDVTIVSDGSLAIGNSNSLGPNYGFTTMGEESGAEYYQEVSEVSAIDGSAVSDSTVYSRMRLETESDDGINTARLWLEMASSTEFYRSELAHLSGQRDITAGTPQFPMEIVHNENTGNMTIDGDYEYQGEDCSVARAIETTQPLLVSNFTINAASGAFIDGEVVISDSADSVVVQFNGDGSATVELTNGDVIEISAEALGEALSNPPVCEL